jgi:hypothetical protein
VQCLISKQLPPVTEEVIDKLRQLHPPPENAEDCIMPAVPAKPPIVIVDKLKLKALARKAPKGRAPGPSGWTLELLLPLLDDDICLEGITLLVQLITNNALDDHSRRLLTSSILLGAAKKDPTSIRPLAMGELFLRLAAFYVLELDKASHPAIFDSIQLALGSPSGSERAMQRIQGAIEASPEEHITIHVDCINAYNVLDRKTMLASVYGDKRIFNSWSTFTFTYGIPSSLLVRDRAAIVAVVPSLRGVKQGYSPASLPR